MNKKLNKQQKPPGWGNDSVSKYLQIVHGNNHATFNNYKGYYKRLSEINDIYEKAYELKTTLDDTWSRIFFMKARSSFLSGVQLGGAGLMAECFMVLRGAIESALYGLYVFSHKELYEVWLRRHQDKASFDKVKSIFTVRNVFDCLEKKSTKLKVAVKKIYDMSIDYGAHPNEKSVTSIINMHKDDEQLRIDWSYITNDENVIKLCLVSTARGGIACLKIFELVEPKIKLSLLDLDIDKAAKGL